MFQAFSVQAQQTIISVPSSELLPAGDIILKESNKASPFSPGGYANLTPSLVMGLGRGLEFSSGVATTLEGNTLVRGDFALKKVFFLGDSTRLTLGGRISPYLNNDYAPDTLAFAHMSQRIKKTRTSMTAGIYVASQRKCLPSNTGVMLGLEQVIIPNKLRFAMDWISREESLGNIGVGLKYRPVPTLSITTAVIIPNNDSDNVAFNVSISKYISLDDENPLKRRLTNVD